MVIRYAAKSFVSLTPQAGISGSLIAQKGFVEQFGTLYTKSGQKALAAPVVTAIGAIQSTGLFFGMITIPLQVAP